MNTGEVVGPRRVSRTLLLGSVLIVFSGFLSVNWGFALQRGSPHLLVDFKGLYYGARCVLHGDDPYSVGAVLRVYREEADGRVPDVPEIREVLTWSVNLPTTFLFTAPVAILPWRIAAVIWIALGMGGLTVSGLLIWRSATESYSKTVLLLVCVLLSGSEILATQGNTAGFVVSFCVVAVWCFQTGEFVWLGVAALAVSLLIKPHDSGLIWFFLLVAGKAYFKRAILSLVMVVLLCLPVVVWFTTISPHWLSELHSNLAVLARPGMINDPTPSSITERTVVMMINLQSVLSMLWKDPHFYNSLAYLGCGGMLAAVFVTTARFPPSPERIWLGLAAVVPLELLITYHRPYDAKLLLLALPACAQVMNRGLWSRCMAVLLTGGAVLFTNDLALALHRSFTLGMYFDLARLSERVAAVLVTRPASLALVAMAIFYTWLYVRRPDDPNGSAMA